VREDTSGRRSEWNKFTFLSKKEVLKIR